MILVTSGHEKGIGLEVLIKALLTNPKLTKDILLYINKNSLKTYLEAYSLDYTFKDQSVEINKYLLLTVIL